ncbi:MAG: gfo/Idh/MocA family oxidoreductase [Spirochaetaceae bacterium]|nr:MAG: gfo/Idh/MocA family oxidoreductase [Spirochaetaceae bacterium]
MEQVRWGIIGCGDVTERKSGPGFQKAAGSTLVAVMRRNADLAADYARRHGVPKWYSDADSLIHDAQVDAVYIASPPVTHVAYIKQVAEAGKPIYCEKPMGIGYSQSSEAVAACKAHSVPLHVAYYRRGLPKYRAARELLQQGRIGDVRYVHASMHTRPVEVPPTGELPWRVRPQLSGGGLILDIGSHVLDLLDFFFGPIRQVKGFAANQGGYYAVEDMVSGAWVFESGVHGSGNWCFTLDREEDQVTIYGSQGRMVVPVLDVAAPLRILGADGNQELTFDSPQHVQQPLIQMVTDELLGRGQSPSTGESALRTDWVLEQLRSSG